MALEEFTAGIDQDNSSFSYKEFLTLKLITDRHVSDLPVDAPLIKFLSGTVSLEETQQELQAMSENVPFRELQLICLHLCNPDLKLENQQELLRRLQNKSPDAFRHDIKGLLTTLSEQKKANPLSSKIATIIKTSFYQEQKL